MLLQVRPQQTFKYTPTARNPPAQVMPGQMVAPAPQAQQAVVIQGQEPLTASMLAAAPPQEQKQMLGERLFPLIQRMYPDLAGKITGMLLEIDNAELLHMLEDHNSLKGKVSLDTDRLPGPSSHFTAGRGGCGCTPGSPGKERKEVNKKLSARSKFNV